MEAQFKGLIFGRKKMENKNIFSIVRLLRQKIEDLLADPRFKNCQYLLFKMYEHNGISIIRAANGGIWWQINVLLIGAKNALFVIIIVTDGSWILKGIICEVAALYGAESVFDQ